MYYAHTDGSSKPHTSHCGGYAVVMETPSGMVTSAAHECNTESQRMELQAIIEALDMVAPGDYITILTDSQYAYKGFQGVWKLKANLDQWATIRKLASKRKVTITWIPRCSDPGSKEADRLAREACHTCPST